MGIIYSNLRVLMAERGFNIQKVKDNTSLSRTTISNLVNNNVNGVQFDTLVQLCELLDCSVGDIIKYSKIRFKGNGILIDEIEVGNINEITKEFEGEPYEIQIKNKYKLDMLADFIADFRTFTDQLTLEITIGDIKNSDTQFLSITYDKKVLTSLTNSFGSDVFVKSFLKEMTDFITHELKNKKLLDDREIFLNYYADFYFAW